MHGRISRLGLFVLTLSCGCARIQPGRPPAHVEPAAELGRDFDPAATGTLQGRVVWDGPIPEVSRLQVYPDKLSQPDVPRQQQRVNPHAPRIDAATNGVSQAVVFLRKVDLRRSRPWDHEPVTVEHHDWNLSVHQGQSTSSIGFVRRGTTFTTISKQNVLHMLRGQDAAYFSLPLPDAEVPSSKRLSRVGHVELSSAVDYFWMRAHLFVDDHPYYACSDADGKFELTNVPAGTYQIVCWLPNWKIAWHERDPESSVVARIQFQPPLAKERQATVQAGETTEVDFTVTEHEFADGTVSAK